MGKQFQDDDEKTHFKTLDKALEAIGVKPESISFSSPKEQRFICPKCEDKSVSFSIRITNDAVFYKCFRINKCDYKGAKFYGVQNFKPAKTRSKEKVSVSPPEVVRFDQLKSQHSEYLDDRKILSAAVNCGLISGKVNNFERLIIPYGDWSKSYDPTPNTGFPWLQEKPKNKALPLWNLPEEAPERIVICEGEWDCLTAIEVGFPKDACYSLPEGAVQPNDDKEPHEHGKLKCITEHFEKFANTKKVVLCLDNDPAGKATSKALIEIFGAWRCAVVEYPKHPKAKGLDGRCKDLNEVLCLFDTETALNVLKNAKFAPLNGGFKPSEIPRPPPREYLSLDIRDRQDKNDLFRPFLGGTFVVSGITGHGKTNFLFWILAILVQDYGLKPALGTFEAEYWEDVVPWYADFLFPEELPDNWESRAHEWLIEHFCIIKYDDIEDPASVEWYLGVAAGLKARHGCNVFVLDPWNKLEHSRKNGEAETDYIGRSLGKIRKFGELNKSMMFISVHPTKAVYAGGDVSVPNLSQLHGSMNWGNSPDGVVVGFRPDRTKSDFLISVQKIRHENKPARRKKPALLRGGVPGRCWVKYDGSGYVRMTDEDWDEAEEKYMRNHDYE